MHWKPNWKSTRYESLLPGKTDQGTHTYVLSQLLDKLSGLVYWVAAKRAETVTIKVPIKCTLVASGNSDLPVIR
jgi:hypothetical protein